MSIERLEFAFLGRIRCEENDRPRVPRGRTGLRMGQINAGGFRGAGTFRGSSAAVKAGPGGAWDIRRRWGRFRGSCGRRYVSGGSAIRSGKVLGLRGVRLFTYIPVRDNVFVRHGNALLMEAESIVLHKDVPIDKATIHIVTRYVKPRLGDNARVPAIQHPVLAGAAGADLDAGTDGEFVVKDERRSRGC